MTPSNSLLKLKKILESRTGKAIGDYNMIEDGDTVLVDQTGGEHLELGTMPEDPDAGSDADVTVEDVTEDK